MLSNSVGQRWIGALGLCAALLVSGTAQAVPVVHDIVSGFVNISVKLDGATIGYAPGVSLIGNTVTVDTAALEITGISVALEETTILLSTPFGGYDNITIETAVLTSDLGFATLVSFGTPDLFTAVASPLTVNGTWGATDSTGTNPDTSGNPIVFPVVSVTAVVNQSPFVQMDSVTINSVDGTPFGEVGRHLTVVADYHILTPEPGTGALLGLGLVALGWRRRSRAAVTRS